MLDVFAWAYQRSCLRYVVIRDSVAEPDRFRLKYREDLAEVIGGMVRARLRPTEAAIQDFVGTRVEAKDLERFVAVVTQEFKRLGDGNIARYKIRRAEFNAWKSAVK